MSQRYFRITNPDQDHPYQPDTLAQVLLLEPAYTDPGWENDFQPKGNPILGLVKFGDLGKPQRARHIIYAFKHELTEVWQAGASRVPDGTYTAVVRDGLAYMERVGA